MKKEKICLLFLGLFLVLGCSNQPKKNIVLNSIERDSTIALLKGSKKKKYSNLLKLDYAKKALELSNKIKDDSLWFASLDRITKLQYRLQDFDSFKENSQRYIHKAIQTEDSIHIAKGNYKLGSYFFVFSQYESAFEYFNKAQLIFGKKKDSIEAAKNLLNMSIIQTNAADYYGSQQTSLEALKYLKSENDKRYTLSVYNNLGIVSNELKLYTDAIHWYERSMELISREEQKIVLYNNIGMVYQNDKHYKKALSYFNKGLSEPNINKYQLQKATLIDNVGYTHFLLGSEDALDKFQEAFLIRKKQYSIRGQIVSNLHLGEYYFSKGLLEKSRNHLKDALKKAKETKDIKNISKALFSLSKLVSSNSYIKRYIEIKDSLIARERLLKFQFASIKLATSEQQFISSELQKKLIVKNLHLEKQLGKNKILLIASIGLLIVLFTVYFYFKQQKRIQHQRHIINTLEARSDEKQRLSMHLHDDIASDLLIGLQRTDLIQKNINNQELEKAITFFDRGYQKIRKISQNLNFRYFGEISFDKRIDKLFFEYSFNNDIHIVYEVDTDIDWDKIEIVVKETIYSLLQEALTNIFKHARATKIDISFSFKHSNLCLLIKDNGVGYSDSENQGLGISYMRKRIRDLSGSFSIKNNSPLKGTTIEILIPNHLLL